jgi:hypothetical protein
MKRYQLVDALAWEKSICVSFFESDDVSIAQAHVSRLSTALNQPLDVIDTWDRANQFPVSANPLFKAEQDIYNWLREHEANQKMASLEQRRADVA